MGKEKFYKNYYLTKSAYYNNNRIYLGLENEQEVFSDITINLPEIMLEENCVALNDLVGSSYICEELEELGLFKVINTVPYNWGNYKIAILNMDIVNKYAIDFRKEA